MPDTSLFKKYSFREYLEQLTRLNAQTISNYITIEKSPEKYFDTPAYKTVMKHLSTYNEFVELIEARQKDAFILGRRDAIASQSPLLDEIQKVASSNLPDKYKIMLISQLLAERS